MYSIYRFISFKKIKEKGFSLIEVLVITFVVALISTLVFVNYREGSKMLDLQRASQKLAQDIRYVQEMSVSGVQCATCSSEPVGYGLFFDKAVDNNTYWLYADIDGDNYYQAVVDGSPIETFDLEEGVIIHEISNDSERICINFSPPDPIVTISYNLGDETQTGYITLALDSDTSQTKKININAAGLVEVLAAAGGGGGSSGECKSGIGGNYAPCDEITYGGYLNCMYPNTCDQCGCECFMAFQCRDPIGGPPLCSSYDESLCNTCGCTWWP